MPKMKKLALLSLLALAATAHADEREWHTYKELVEGSRIDKFYAIPPAERDKLQLYVKIVPKNKAIRRDQLTLTVLDGSERQSLPILAHGRFNLVPNQKWLNDDAKTLISLPASEKAGFGMDMLTPLPDGSQWHYTQVMSSVAQSNAAIKKMAGALSLFAPTIKVVVFKFDKPAQLRIESKDGVKTYASDAKGYIKLSPDTGLLKENPLMSASERPFEAELDTE